ncbi:tripartite motif-containing protein 16-like [Acanthochromis polyacanthus]|uniref:tripartite motif-containing protein 16-like n=1 Tax=Acanthochromis polyacanthus TaxID=80966 RepID=UPI002234D7BC|nr:tripartite motif-containing protein 16-like [Acanthochromis polyacanthus]
MAQQGIQMDQEKLSCSICLNLLKDPVTIPCGHSYCMDCIKDCWDGEDQNHIYSCPQCRQMFRSRPDLKKSTVLADLVEEVKKTRLESVPADLCYAGPGDVSCDFCTGRKLKAVKSCLQCLVSYCDQHLQPHYHVAALKNHKLVDPSKKLQENICSGHNEVMKIFCRTDQQCICYLCSLDEHKGHDIVSAAGEWKDKQRVVGLNQEKIQQRIQDREKDVRMLQQEVEVINQSADKAVANSEETFKDLIRLIEKRNSDVKQQIRSKQTDEVRKVRDLEEKLKQELVELRRISSELEQLSQTEDHIQFLHDYPLMSNLSDSKESPSIRTDPELCFEVVTAAVSEAREKLQDILSEKWILKMQESPQGVPKTRDEFLKYSRRFTLEKNRANGLISLSLFSRKARVEETSSFSMMKLMLELDNQQPGDIDDHQVQSAESLTGRCYWEVDWSGNAVSVAVSYTSRNMLFKSGFGTNATSWALYCVNNRFEFRHNSIITPISGPRSSRIGVYLDHSAGILSFYRVSDTMTLIHRVQTTFTQPLYAGFLVGYGCTVQVL